MRRLRLVPDDTRVPFFRYRWIAFAWSVVVLAGTILLVATSGLNLGVDFRGGVLLEVRTPGPADLALMRSTLGELDLGDVSLQTAGGDDQVMIRARAPEGDPAGQQAAVERIKAALDARLGAGLTYERAEFVGPRVSQELLVNSVWAVLISLLGVLLYLWFRFEWQYGIGAIAALIHDVSASIGIYAVSGLEFNLTSVAAVLTIVGYSLNDTVVIYDRVRENLRRYKAMPIEELLDRSINETLPRTMMTALTTLVALLPLWLFGGEVIRGFTIIMIWGVLIGTYSTVYIATPLLYYLNLRSGTADQQQPKQPAAQRQPAR
jgi:preprotein translocase subunit SecF